MPIKKLSELKKNETGFVVKVSGDIHIRRRLLELGITSGQAIKVLAVSMLKNSLLIEVRHYTLALRKNSLELISVKTDG